MASARIPVGGYRQRHDPVGAEMPIARAELAPCSDDPHAIEIGERELALVGTEGFAESPRQPLDRARQGCALPFGPAARTQETLRAARRRLAPVRRCIAVRGARGLRDDALVPVDPAAPLPPVPALIVTRSSTKFEDSAATA